MIALLLAAMTARGPQLVPAAARSALVIETKDGADGLRAFFGAAGAYAPSLAPDEIGRMLRAQVGVDLLGDDRAWGLAAGVRALVGIEGASGLVAPVRDARIARRALTTWLKAADRRRPRAGRITSGRLVTASGKRAATLVSLFSRSQSALASVSGMRPALLRANAPAWLYVRPPGPLRAAVFAVDASAQGLVLRGIALPGQRGALLSAKAAARCDESAPGCLSFSPGELGRALEQSALHEIIGAAFAPAARPAASRALEGIAASAERTLLRLDGVDTRALAGGTDSLWALRWSAAATPAQVESATLEGARPVCVEQAGAGAIVSSPCGPGPVLAPGDAPLLGALDLAAIDGALSRMTPLDALRGDFAAGAYAAHFLYGKLLQHAGPLTLRGGPAKDAPDAAELELRLPLR